MLDQLVESKNNERENKTRAEYLVTTAALVVCICFSAVLYSLFAKDLGAGVQDLELSVLVAPIADTAPSELIKKQEKSVVANKSNNDLPIRQANILRIDESPINTLNVISVVPNSQKSRPSGNFLVGDKMETDGVSNANFGKAVDGKDNGGIDLPDDLEEASNAKTKISEPPPLPPIKKTVEEKTKKSTPAIMSGGVVNGRAQFLPKPTYSAAAKSLRLNGEVSVQVLIDENGKVVSAKAVNGHLLFRNEAENAARNAKFEPTLLSEKPVKVSGVIVYKFSMQ